MVLPRCIPALRMRLTAQARAGSRAVIQRRPQLVARRWYATGHDAPKKSSDIPWLLGSVVFTVPAALWLLSSGPPETEHGLMPERPLVQKHEDSHDEEKPKDDEKEEEEAAPSDDSESEGEQKETPPSSEDEGDNKPSERDPPKAAKSPESPSSKSGAQSAKQKGVSNTETKNPRIEEPDKSRKAEGDIESAKLTGTVSPERPQGEQKS